MSGNIAQEKQRIADLLESLDLYLEWLYIFVLLCLKLKKNGKAERRLAARTDERLMKTKSAKIWKNKH